MTGDDPGRGELARFLRTRRERIDPTQVGLPVSRRRRSRGLRREEVAVLAGVSPTWYTYLEQGRNIRPSPAVLDSLARVLQLTEDERQYMHLLVFGHAPRPLETPEIVPLTDMVTRMVECYGHAPYPIYAFDEIGDLLAWNDATAEWYTDFDKLPAERRNMMWWMLTAPEAKDRIADWEQDCRDVVARYRAFVAMRHNDPRISMFIDAMQAASPDFARWWIEHEVHGSAQRPRIFRHPVLGTRTMYMQLMVPAESDSVRIAFHLPAEDTDSA